MDRLKKIIQNLSTADKVLIILIFAYALLGTVLIGHYGEGWDNVWMYEYGISSLKIYLNPTESYSIQAYGPSDLRYFGPFIVTVAAFATKVLGRLNFPWEPLVIFRYIYFLTHLMGIVFFYCLAKRFLHHGLALFATALYVTQPLFFGLALLNPKDTPFTAFFIASVFTGLTFIEALTEEPPDRKKIFLRMVIAGVFWGLSISIRILALVVGGLILAVILVSNAKKKALFPFVGYGIVAALTTYLSWPFLWPAPLSRFLESFRVNFGHQHHTSVLFNGQSYPSEALPRSYLPTLLSIQFTEPVVLLSLAGILLFSGLFLFKGIKHYTQNETPNFFTNDALSKLSLNKHLIVLLVLWFCVPLIGIIIINPSMHDNFRHFFFITPPLFIFAGIMFDFLAEKIRIKWIILLLAACCLAPGIFNIVSLHPYEYIYFNSFVGGVGNSFGRFRMDYMAVSLKESFDFVNETASSNATVLVFGPADIAQVYARPDLKLLDRFEYPDLIPEGETYLVSINPEKDDAQRYVIYQVLTDGAVIGTVLRYR